MESWRAFGPTEWTRSLSSTKKAIYFFRKDKFQRFDLEKNEVIKEGTIDVDGCEVSGRPGWTGSLSSCGQTIFFFRGDEYQRFNTDRARGSRGDSTESVWMPGRVSTSQFSANRPKSMAAQSAIGTVLGPPTGSVPQAVNRLRLLPSADLVQ